MCRYVILVLVIVRSILGEEWEEGFQVSKWKIEGEFLYWQAIQDQMYYALAFETAQPNSRFGGGFAVGVLSPEIAPSAVMKKQATKFSPGFRLGAFYDVGCFCSQGWQVGAKWTSFHQSTYSHIASDDYLIGAVLLANPLEQLQYNISHVSSYNSANKGASSRWSLDLDSIDLSIVYKICLGEKLECSPYCGVKGVCVYQKQEVQYVDFLPGASDSYFLPSVLNNVGVSAMHTFKGGGPTLGVKTLSSLCFYDTQFFVDVAMSCIYARSTDRATVGFNIEPPIGFGPSIIYLPFSTAIVNKLWVLKPIFECMFGVQYQSSSLYKGASVFFKLAGEVQLWTGQWNRFTNVAHAMNIPVPLEGSLMLQGVTASCGIQF